jgi:hypothetical protein
MATRLETQATFALLFAPAVSALAGGQPLEPLDGGKVANVAPRLDLPYCLT